MKLEEVKNNTEVKNNDGKKAEDNPKTSDINLALISLSIVYFTFNKYAIRSADALNKIYKE